MSKRRSVGGKVLMVLAVVGAFVLGGATYGAVEMAGASGTTTTFYACLTAGSLSKVGTRAPSCSTKGSTVISWNSVGSRGATGAKGARGPQGPAGPLNVYQQEGSGNGNSVVVNSSVLPDGTYLVNAAALVNVGPGSSTECTIGTTGSGDTVLGNQGLVENPVQDYGSGGNAVLNDTVVLTKPDDQIELTCGSDVDYSMTEQKVTSLSVN